MAVIRSKVDINSDTFRSNLEDMLAKIHEFRTLEQKVIQTSNREREKFLRRGQMLPRERVAALLDPGSRFLHFSTLAGLRMDDDDGLANVFGGGIISGIGCVSGVRCVVICNDSAIKGGTSVPMGSEKVFRAQEIALINKLPVIHLIESGGGNLTRQAQTFVRGGRKFFNMARTSAAGIPQICVVHGSSTAGGAYAPGMSDYVVMVRKRAKVFLAGPPLLKAATGEIADDERLGGADMHASGPGTTEWVAEDDADAITIAREIVAHLHWDEDLPQYANKPIKPPRYSADELVGVVPVDYHNYYDVREVIARIVDESEFLDFKELYDSFTVCGWARIEGYPCGIIGNNGPLTPKGATKAAQFIQLCCQKNSPIVYLQNTTGYMVGIEAESNGIVKHGSKMIQAVSNATVPQITLIIGASFGAGNYGMCGRSFGPRFLFAWPNARIAVMGGEQAARVLSTVTEATLRRKGKPVDKEALDGMENQIIAKFDAESTALFATARIWDDGIIDPRDSRSVLGHCLAICKRAETRTLYSNTFGVARM